MSFALNRRALLMSALAAVPAVCGCGYVVGPANDGCIASVEVVTFKNETFRRGLDLMLTEAIQKEIQKRSAIRIAKGDAHTRLTGRIVDFRKNVLGETRFDDGRELQTTLIVEVTWEDLREGRIIAQQDVSMAASTAPLATPADFAPETGHSLATALHDSVQQTARRIVDMMDAAW